MEEREYSCRKGISLLKVFSRSDAEALVKMRCRLPLMQRKKRTVVAVSFAKYYTV